VAGHDGVGGAAGHEVAAVGSSGVVGLQPALELGVEVGEAGEVLAVEGRAVELLEGGALEAFADGVVVGRARRDPVVTQAALAIAAVNWRPVNSGPLSLRIPVSSAPMPAKRSATWSTKAAVSRADLSPVTRAPIA